MWHKVAPIVFILSATGLSAAVKELRPVTLRQVIDHGMKQGREMRRIDTVYGEARARYRETRSSFVPSVTLTGNDNGQRTSSIYKRLKKSGSLDYSFTNPGRGGNNSRSITWKHPFFRTNDINLDEAELNYAIAQFEKTRQQVEFRFQIVQQYYEVLRLQERVKVSANAVERWKKLLDFARARYELGTSTKIDVLNAQVNLGNSENSLLANEQSLASRRDSLSDYVGYPVDIHLEAKEPLTFTTADISMSDDWLREDLAVSRLRVERARWRSRNARRNARPDLDWESEWTDNEGSPSEVVHSVSWTFQLGRRTDEWTFLRLQENERTTRIELDRLAMSISIDQRDAKRRLERLERSIRIAQASVRQAEESMEFSQFSFEKGVVSAIELREAQGNLTNARSNLVNLLIDYRIAVFQYERAMGGDLE